MIPAPLRRALDIEPGDELVLTLDDGAVRITTRGRAIARAQEHVRQYTGGEGSLVEDLLDERRAEAAGD